MVGQFRSLGQQTTGVTIRFGIVFFLFVRAALSQEIAAPVEASTPARVVGWSEAPISTLPDPDPFPKHEPILDQVDWAHDWLFLSVQRRALWFDSLFSEDPLMQTPVSRFRLSTLAEAIDNNGVGYGIDTDFDMDVNLPNAEQQLKLFITNEELNELPGSDEFDSPGDLRFGIRRQFFEYIDFDIGVRAKWPVDAFASMRWAPVWEAGSWSVYPGVSVFSEVEEGLGTRARFTADRWNGKKFFRTSSGVRWSEETEGAEWSQSFLAGYAHQVFAEDRFGARASGRDIAHGSGLRLSARGSSDGPNVSSYHASLFTRFPLRDQWLYGVIAPEVTFRNDHNWDAEFGLKIGLDMLFWDLVSR